MAFSATRHLHRLTSPINSLAWIALVALGLAASCFQILNSDIFWHLTTGRWMATGASGRGFLPPLTDPFSFTGPASGRPWIDLHWLFQWMAYAIWSLGGFSALIWAKMFLVVFWIALFFIHFRKGLSAALATPAIALGLLAAHPRLMVRPEMLSFTYAIVLGLALERFFQKPSKLVFAIILGTQWLWVNSQGIFVIGLILIATYAAWEIILPPRRHKRAALLLGLASLFVCLINPYGFQGFRFPLTLYTRIDSKALNIYASQIGEFFPTLDRVAAIEPSYLFFFKTYAVVLGIALAVNLALKNHRPERWCFSLALFYLSLRANRNVALFCLATLPLFLATLADIEKHWPLRGVLKWSCTLGALLFCLVQVPGLTTNATAIHDLSVRRSGFGLRATEYPVAAIDLLKKYNLTGHFFAEYQHFGYLLWHIPGARISFDGRLEIYSEADFRDYLFFLTGGWADRSSDPDLAFARFQESLQSLNQPQPLTGVLLNIESQTIPLTVKNMLRLHQDWALVTLNLNSALFLNRHLVENARAIEENEITLPNLQFPAPLLADSEQQRRFFTGSKSNRLFFSIFPNPLPYPEETLRTGQFLLNLGQREAAGPYLAAPLQAGFNFSDSYLAQSLLDPTLEEKIQTVNQGIARFPNNPQLYYRKAKLFEQANPPQSKEALAALSQALEQDDRFFPALIAKSQWLLHLQRYDERLALLKTAHAKRVKHPDLLLALNEEYVRRGEHVKALQVLKDANLIFHGEDPEVWFRMAFSQRALKQPTQAKTSLARAKSANEVFFNGKIQNLRAPLAAKISALENQI